MRTIFIPLIILITLTACEKEVVTYPKFIPKLVVSGYISPDDDQCRFLIYNNSNIYGDAVFYHHDSIVVTICDDQIEHSLTLNSDSNGYVFNTTEFQISEGKTYTLKISGGKDLSITGSCTVPYRRNFEPRIDTTTQTQSYFYDDSLYFMKSVNAIFNFTDARDEPNYYAIFPELIKYDSRYVQNPSISYIYASVPGSQLYSAYNNFMSDKNLNGKRINIALNQIIDHLNADSVFIKVYLLNIDKHYYDYKNSLANYSSGEDPFTEASPVYSNISGGLGIFASYTMDSVVFRLK